MANMLQSKGGKMSGASVEQYMYLFILLILLFKFLADLYPEGKTAGDELNSSGFPLGSLFASGGVVWLVIAGSVIFLIVRSTMRTK